MYNPISNRCNLLILIKKISIPLFLIFYIGFYYSEYLAYIKIGYAFLGVGFLCSFISNRVILHSKVFALMFLFVMYSFVTCLWAQSQILAISSVILLAKGVIIAFLFSQMINSVDDFKWAMQWLCVSGFIYALLYLSHVSIDMLGNERISQSVDDPLLPNVNVVAMIASFSFVYFIYTYIIDNSRFNAPLAIVAAITVIIMGSRKSILAIVLSSFILLFKLDVKSKIKIGVLLSLMVILAVAIIPPDYLMFISERFGQLGASSNFMDQADQERVQLFHNGVDYILHSPFIGYGFYNFSIVNGQSTGVYLYSHNNFIETIVGGGFFAFLIYYSLYFIVFKNLRNNKMRLNYGFIIMIMMVILLFNQIAIVVLLDKYVWMLLTLLLVGSSFYKKNPSTL